MLGKWRKRYKKERFIQKKINQKIRQRPRRDLVERASKKIKRKLIIITVTTGILLTIVAATVLGNSFFYGSAQHIDTVVVASGSLQSYTDPGLLTAVTDSFEGQSRRAMKWFGIHDIVTPHQENYPIIDTIVLQDFAQGVMTIDIKWHTPPLVYRLPGDTWYGSYQEYLFSVDPTHTLIEGSRVIDLPRYTESFMNIDGIYREFSEKELIDVLTTIDTLLDPQNISERIYLPGGKKLFLGYDSKRWYFHLNKNLNTQIDKLLSVQQFYTDYENISIIDLGSTDNVIVK